MSAVNELTFIAAVSLHVREPRFRNLGTFYLWNPESWALESRIQLKESGIPLRIGIRNPSSICKESGLQHLESGIHGAESRIQLDKLDSLTKGEQLPTWGEQLLTWPSHNKRILWKRWKISSLGWWMVSIMSLPDSATTFKCCNSSREEDASRPTKSTLKVIPRKSGCWGWF